MTHLELQQIQALQYLRRRGPSPPIQRRAAIIVLLDEGHSVDTIAELVGLSMRQVRHWIRQFEACGMDIFPDHVLLERPVAVVAGRPASEGDGVAPALAPPPTLPDSSFDIEDPARFVNRELSLLEFQRRVLQEAQDERNPLLERVKFLAIVGSNLDEFFMVRVGGLKKQVAGGVADLSPDGLTPAAQLAAIRRVAHALMREAQTYLDEVLIPALADEGIFLYQYADLNDKHRAHVKRIFDKTIFPVLTPLAFDPGHPFPHISNLSLNLAVLIRDTDGREHFARVKVPGSIPRLLPIKRSSGSVRKDGTVPQTHHFVWVEQVIAANLETLFPGMEVVEAHPFHITRNAEMAIQELEADDLLETMEEGVRQRRFGSVVRVTINPDMPRAIRNILSENLGMDRKDAYVLDGPLSLSNLMALPGNVERFDLRNPHFVPAVHPQLRSDTRDSDLFGAIAGENFLLHHPYDSFTPVVDFLEQAAADPDVLAIKQTLYRVGKNSPVVKALLKARENGKQVAVLVELKARFDEESNISWARVLEQQGVHVIYGLLGLKTHSKIALVVRKEGDRIRRYIHLSTGNYNAVTAHLYEDIGFFTTDEAIGADASDLFNFLTGYSYKKDYRKLLVAPINLRARMQALIEREIEHQRMGRTGRLILKTNALVDMGIIKLLYQASQAGVEIDLLVRGICCLRPGIPGLSETIRVTSVVGRFLEHSRIYYFRNGGDEQIYLGSADLMPRNINRRVEVVFPIEDERFIRHLHDDVLATYLADTAKARRMQPDGSYERVTPASDAEPISVQASLLDKHVKQSGSGAKQLWEVF